MATQGQTLSNSQGVGLPVPPCSATMNHLLMGSQGTPGRKEKLHKGTLSNVWPFLGPKSPPRKAASVTPNWCLLSQDRDGTRQLPTRADTPGRLLAKSST